MSGVVVRDRQREVSGNWHLRIAWIGSRDDHHAPVTGLVALRRFPSVQTIDVLWTSEELVSAEHFRLEANSAGARLCGTTVILFEERPGHLSYEVVVDEAWRTRSARIELTGHRSVRYDIVVDRDNWSVNGIKNPALTGCVDIDLGWTPATNILPIRRLGVDVGDAAEVNAAWLQYPEVAIVSNRQRYERLADTTWRYQSGRYDFILDTTANGIVTRYGDDLWTARSVSIVGT